MVGLKEQPMRIISILSLSLIVSLGVCLAPAHADEFPTPPAGWWEDVEPGDKATFSMSSMGQSFTMELEVESIEGTQISVRTIVMMGGQMLQDQVNEMDAESEFAGPGAGSTVTHAGSETITVDGVDYDCEIYEVTGAGESMKAWYCADLCPVFSGGNVRLEMVQQGTAINMDLVSVETANSFGGGGGTSSGSSGGATGGSGTGALAHVSSGQEYVYTMQGGIEQVWTVTGVADNHVNYSVQTVMNGNPMGPATELEWAYDPDASGEAGTAQGAAEVEDLGERTITVSGIDFTCHGYKTTAGGMESESWVAWSGGQPTFPPLVVSKSGGNVVMELTEIRN
jgi:hypothetical protein